MGSYSYLRSIGEQVHELINASVGNLFIMNNFESYVHWGGKYVEIAKELVIKFKKFIKEDKIFYRCYNKNWKLIIY